MKQIEFYIKDVYGAPMEYVANQDDAKRIQFLTGKKTVNKNVRDAIESLSGGQIKFVQVMRPPA